LKVEVIAHEEVEAMQTTTKLNKKRISYNFVYNELYAIVSKKVNRTDDTMVDKAYARLKLTTRRRNQKYASISKHRKEAYGGKLHFPIFIWSGNV